jgi:hypothetical protein
MIDWLFLFYIVLSIIAGIGLTTFYIRLQESAFNNGVQFGEKMLRQAMGLPLADDKDTSKGPADPTLGMTARPQNVQNIIFDKYELVFSLDLASFISTGHFAVQWLNIINRVNTLIKDRFTTFPPGTNTIIVRSVRLQEDGPGEFIFEPVNNPNLEQFDLKKGTN